MLVMTLFTLALAATQPVAAPVPGAGAILAAPGEAHRAILDGRAWSCGMDGICVGRGPGVSQPASRECRRFVARFGAVTRYVRDDRALTQAELAQCNTAARAGR